MNSLLLTAFLALPTGELSFALELVAAEARWRAFVPLWFDFLDRDGNRQLSKQEFRLAPSPEQVRSQWRSGLYPPLGQAGADLVAADRDGNGWISLHELDGYYRRGGAGPLHLIRVELPGTSRLLSAALFKLIDRDANGRLTPEDRTAASDSVRRVDLNEDDLVTPEELLGVAVAVEALPGRRFRFYRQSGQPALAAGIQAFFRQRFTVADRQGRHAVKREDLDGDDLLPLRTIFALADRDDDGRLTSEELTRCTELSTRWLRVPMTFSVSITRVGLFELLDADGDGRLSLRDLKNASEVPDRNLPLAIRIGWSAGPPGQESTPRPAVRPSDAPTWFQHMDRNGDNDVSRREFTGPEEVFRNVDADGDGLISASEATRWGHLQRPRPD